MDGNQGSRCTYNIGSLKIISEFAGRLDASEKQAARVATERVDTRIAQYLADCVENQNGNLEINLPMTRKNLASYLGITPETISGKLSELEILDYIKQISAKRIKIIDLESLLLI